MLQLRTEDVGSQPERGTRVLTMRELAQIWIAFEQSRASRGLKLAAKLVILLGCRSGEALGRSGVSLIWRSKFGRFPLLVPKAAHQYVGLFLPG